MRKFIYGFLIASLLVAGVAFAQHDGIGGWDSGSGVISNVVEDTTPQLGGNLDGQTYDISTSGSITGTMDVVAAASGAVTVATAGLNNVRISSGAGDWNLPADSCDAATGNWLTVVANAAHVASITSLDTGDQFVLADGTVLTADNELDTAGSAWDSCTVICVASGIWLVIGERGTCADGGAAD